MRKILRSVFASAGRLLRIGAMRGSYTPLSLFAMGEQGVWFDNSDFERYTAPVGSELVSSYNNNGAYGNLNSISLTGTTLTASTSPSNGYSTRVSVSAGKSYRVTPTTVPSAGGGTWYYQVWYTTTGTTYGGNVATYPLSSTSFVFTAPAGAVGCEIGVVRSAASSAGATDTCSNFGGFSVREMTGLDTATLFQDSSGTTPVTALEQPVGLRLDKSKGLSLGSELVSNGTFDSSTTGWTGVRGTLAVSSGQLTVTGTGSYPGVYQAFSTTSGTLYRVTFSVPSLGTTTTLRVTAKNGTTDAAADIVSFDYTSTGTKTFMFFAAGANSTLFFLSQAPVAFNTFTIDNVSAVSVAGNHAYQSTAAARAVLSARYNALAYTEELTSTYWSKNPSITVTKSGEVGTITVPNTIASGTNIFFKQSIIAFTSGPTSRARIEVRCATGQSITLASDGGAVTVAMTSEWQTINLTSTIGSGFHQFYIRTAVGSQSYSFDIRYPDLRLASESSALPAYQRVGAAVAGTSTAAGTPDYDATNFPVYLRYDGGDWYQTPSIDFSGVPANAPLGSELVTNGTFDTSTTGWSASGVDLAVVSNQLVVTNNSVGFGYTYTAVPTVIGRSYIVTGTVVGASLSWVFRVGDDATGNSNQKFNATGTTAGQAIYSFFVATANTTYIRLGVNNTTISQTATFDNISVREVPAAYAPDKIAVFAGVTKLSDANIGMIVETSVSSSSNNGTIFVTGPNPALTNGYSFSSKGTTASAVSTLNYIAPITNIITGIGDISAPASVLRIDGLQIASSSATQGTGNFGNYPLYIGARAGTSLYFTGREYGLIIRAGLPTDTQVSQTEDYLDAKTFGRNMLVGYFDQVTTSSGDPITTADGGSIYMTSTYS